MTVLGTISRARAEPGFSPHSSSCLLPKSQSKMQQDYPSHASPGQTSCWRCSPRSELAPLGTHQSFLQHLLYRSPHRRQSGLECYSGEGSKPNSSRLWAAREASGSRDSARRAAAEQVRGREEEKIRVETYSNNSCTPGGRELILQCDSGEGAFPILNTYLTPNSIWGSY